MSPSDLCYDSGVGGVDGEEKEDGRETRVQEMPYFIKRPLQDTSELLPSMTPRDAFSIIFDNPKHLGPDPLRGSPLARQYPAAQRVARA